MIIRALLFGSGTALLMGCATGGAPPGQQAGFSPGTLQQQPAYQVTTVQPTYQPNSAQPNYNVTTTTVQAPPKTNDTLSYQVNPYPVYQPYSIPPNANR